YIGRFMVTASTRRWALTSAQEMKGLGVSATLGPGEAGVEKELSTGETPDNRPGYILDVGHRERKELEYWLITRIRKGALPVPTTSVFDAMPKEMIQYYVEVKDTPIQLFGDGYEEIVERGGRTMYKIPRMDGFFHIETKFGVAQGVAGGNFLILAESQASALLAAEVAVDAMKEIPLVFNPCAGGVAASGTKVGGRTYKQAVATTNDAYCATIKDRVEESKIPPGVNCVYEVFVNGLDLASVERAMKVGIEAAATVAGVRRITAGNYGGKLGKTLIPLKRVLGFH
ncbi:formylmethanofuran--tetrahydromethanopterin N-formyltransferase, partial [Candidatus Bathyarchaeota archaeon]|nr:formylmethanofuran--tetrahydromethanopterin N-formyltransferase [Candidatus Bathyarchaeota archaeon]